jgi:hypothetical protein
LIICWNKDFEKFNFYGLTNKNPKEIEIDQLRLFMEISLKSRSIKKPFPGATSSNAIFVPNGKQYPLRYELREPTPEDLVSASQEVLSNVNQGEIDFTNLSTEEINHLIKRLPDIQTEKEDEQEFKVREKSLKAPITGDEKLQEFPPKESFAPPKIEETTSEETELKIERYLPEGKVPMASQLT